MSYKLGSRLEVLGNRRKFLKQFRVDINKTIAMWVEHGDKVEIADEKLAGKSVCDWNYAAKADALITNKKNLFLFLLIADCLPVILYDPQRVVCGLAHVGWKNADINSIAKVVKQMQKLYKANPSSLIVGFGPAARKNSYIKDKIEQLKNPKWKEFIEKVKTQKKCYSKLVGGPYRNCHPELVLGSNSKQFPKQVRNDGVMQLYRIDFVAMCIKQLTDAGVKGKNIFDCGIDTVKDKRFFSHFRDSKIRKGDHGRFACVVGMI